jgi:serine/threonine protein kinase
MGDRRRWMIETLPPELAAQVAHLCHEFEARWQTGQRPSIDDYLHAASPSVRTHLLGELLEIDLAHRWRNAESPTLAEYSSRFPSESGLIQAVFRDTPTVARRSKDAEASVAAAARPVVPGYEILGELAPGGMGIVYQARQVATDLTVALKMIRTGIHAEPEERARFRVEAEAIATLAHPNVIRIHDVGEWNDVPYIAMEFAAGGSLARRLHGGPLSPGVSAELVEVLAKAVDFVHEHGIIHRDLKPANVLFTEQGVPKLADFGLAKRLDQDQGLTRTQAVLGTASYMAPEQAAGLKHAIGPAADIYALGAILYEVLTGQPPFRAETRELTIQQVLSVEPVPPSQIRPELPAELEAICLKCLEKEPGRRFTTASELAEELRRYRDGQPISIRLPGVRERHARSAQRMGYEILDVLEAGTLGNVYKARHIGLNRSVVLELLASQTIDTDGLARLRAEAEIVAQLHHANILELYDFGELNGEPFIAREFLEGKTLEASLTDPPLSAEDAATLVETLARAVHHAHSQGIVHGQLQPAKVLIGTDGTCKISGFGQTEALRQRRSVDLPTDCFTPAADVYALGSILYRLLTGKMPEAGSESGGSVRQVRPELSRDLEAACLKCLEPNPGQRYPNAAALAEDLRRFRTGEVLFVADLDEWAQQQRWARRAGFEILELLGQSDDGLTYKARQVAFDRIVVLKRITVRHRFVPQAKEGFRWRARFLARVRHPNIVHVYDQGEQNDLCFFTREYVDGPSLAETLAEEPDGEAAEDRAWEGAELVETLARAIQAAHGRGIVHGGLNPSKIHFTSSGVAKITSFHRTRPHKVAPRLAGYMAPELLMGGRRLDPSMDVYSLGAMLYALLTGRPPFLGQTLEETISKAQTELPALPRSSQDAIPPELEDICLRCLEKTPARRPASAETLADELRKLWINS